MEAFRSFGVHMRLEKHKLGLFIATFIHPSNNKLDILDCKDASSSVENVLLLIQN